MRGGCRPITRERQPMEEWTMQGTELDELTRGFLTAALWADCLPADDGETGGCEHLTPDAELTEWARDACERFLDAAGDDLELYADRRAFNPAEGTAWEHVGHDLWLSCHRHGTGLWDRTDDDLGQCMHDVAVSELAYVEHRCPFDKGDGTAGLS